MDFHKPGPNKRVCAFMIDVLLITIFDIVISYLFKKVSYFIIIGPVYLVFRDCFNGQSLGKRLVGLQVIDKEGSIASPSMTIKRNAIMLIPLVEIVEYFVMVSDQEEGKRIGDRIAKTKVNDLRPQTSDSIFLFISVIVLIVTVGMHFSAEKAIMERRANKIAGKNYYDKAIRANSSSPENFYNRGLTQLKSSNFKQAIADFNKAIEIEPNFAAAYLRRGNSYAGEGDFERAISDYNKAIMIVPAYVEAYSGRGLAYIRRSDFDRAIADFTRSIEIKPGYAEIYSDRAAAYLYKNNFDLAIADCNKAIEIDTNFVDAYIYRANAYFKKGNLDMAISDYNKAIEINPKNSDAYLGRAYAYYNLGQYFMAWDDIHKAESLGRSVDPEFLTLLKKDSGRDN